MQMPKTWHECLACGGRFKTLPALSGHIRFRRSSTFQQLDKKRNEVAGRIQAAALSGRLDPEKALTIVAGLPRMGMPLLDAADALVTQLLAQRR